MTGGCSLSVCLGAFINKHCNIPLPSGNSGKMSSRSFFICFSFNKLDSLNILFDMVQVDRVEVQDVGTQKG
jgi:hypothetical protein